MTTVEFNALVHEGQIVVPEVYQNALNQAEIVKIAVTVKTSTSPSQGAIARLMKQPLQVENLVPLSREEVHERG